MIVAAGAGFWAWQRFTHFADGPLEGLQPGTSITVERGDSLPVVVRKLRAAGIDTGQPLEWRVLAKQLGAAGRLQVGEYALAAGMSPRALLIAMRDGNVVSHGFTIVEGWNIRQLRAALARARPLEQEAAQLDDATLMKTIGHAGQHPEGRFLPETYVYTRGDSDLDVLRRAHDAMEKALDAAWQRRRSDSVLKTPDEMLALASIVEKETGVASERPQIAGLFERRLKIGMRLQTDPTVIYGLGPGYDGNIRKRDLLADTPYNSYTRAGLPPTPIAMPGADALAAVAQPAPGEHLYFVAIGDGSGRHLFARTLAEHEANVQAYLRNYRAARAKSSQ
ncbi:endolytic transglycosylase MltG [Montanilutibacter psychrotolerans]|uniref:Endolytic murein transglycosylase n=1 Tax=Montanilutibacter psychrotolerans TaxID=1327343 RepID=A0A3M8SVV2_9GAMM|nr:endolytic transglycosylase MltG [Lysobacter psychrotolerans]RNF85461.1 endolytic transglycosylase MltG [Lysobacter psychrotolerans]